MPRVVLIPTGRMEYDGLGPALRTVFSEVEFVCEPETSEPRTLDRKLFGFTSNPIPAGGWPNKPGKLDELVARVAAAVNPGRNGIKADHVILIDDLELANRAQPLAVIEEVRKAVRRQLAALTTRLGAQAVQRTADALKERASFHLLAPMVEAYLFADPDALARAGALTNHPPELVSGRDLEQFQVANPSSPKPPDGLRYEDPFPDCQARNPDRDPLYPWEAANRGEHPKHYLQFIA